MDFVFSIVVLVLILSLLGSTWLNLQSSIAQQENRKRAIETSALAADFLVSSQGYPENWEKSANLSISSVSNLGLKGSKGLSLEKLLAIMNLSSDYYGLKAKAGLARYDYRLVVYENLSTGKAALSGVARQPIAYFASDSRNFFTTIDQANVTWDYYWGQGGQAQPAWGSSRNQYGGEKATIFNQMLANQSSYDSFVIESPEMLFSQINFTLLKDFLNKGGVVVYLTGNAESELLIQNLTVSFRKAASGVNGVVQEKGFFLQNTSVGSNVSSIGQWTAFSPNGVSLKIFASNSTNSSEAIAAAWNYGLGRVYFTSDFNANFNGVQGKAVFNIIGWKLDYGITPYANASFVFPQTRFSFIEGDKRIPVAVTLVLWNG